MEKKEKYLVALTGLILYLAVALSLIFVYLHNEGNEINKEITILKKKHPRLSQEEKEKLVEL